VKNINRLCPDIDVIGINSYGGGPSIAKRYRDAGGTKPFVITEFGPPGVWEVGKNSWDAPTELTSTAKGAAYRATYEQSILAEKGKLSLGSYVFAWGNKQEATATWYGLFLPDGARLESIDVMTELWSGRKPANRCPQIASLKPDGKEPGRARRDDSRRAGRERSGKRSAEGEVGASQGSGEVQHGWGCAGYAAEFSGCDCEIRCARRRTENASRRRRILALRLRLRQQRRRRGRGRAALCERADGGAEGKEIDSPLRTITKTD
jgi:hypothetical protein